MDRETRGLLVGMTLGDGYLQVRHRMQGGKYPYIAAAMSVKHSVNQTAYCEHKAELLRKATGRKCHVRFGSAEAAGKRYKQAMFSFSHPYIRVLRGWMYKDGVKWVTPQVLSYLTPHGIALWYMDDGSGRVNRNKENVITSCSMSIATMCSKEEVQTISDYFLGEHGIEFKIRYDKRRAPEKAHYIEANTENSKKFAGLIADYVIPSMQYKIAHVASLGSHEYGGTSRSAKAMSEYKI